ncbi:hypothetical protein F5B22DRAFT_481926 [Xylaria bambusicola]|uniref:uncharacterized protein n=1 Tax=Xylaria bambusicola TaxID=326684 RepID=UPI0020081477|nr:uncharacterized protein F5B22DRAFT_481926 [Xylaria bambusicola]KAI0506049.1 hypothetical protein F5B22DRAFT_481926 [Xylaria bambusicola]
MTVNDTVADLEEAPAPNEQDASWCPYRSLSIFGNKKPWHIEFWREFEYNHVARADGTNECTLIQLSLPKAGPAVRFHGVTTGFASYRSPARFRWDLWRSVGLRLVIEAGDDKIYSIAIRDMEPPGGCEKKKRNRVEWECNFRGRPGFADIYWEQFQPTVRGTRPLDLSNISDFRISLCNNPQCSFVPQKGPFELDLVSIEKLYV